MKRTGYITLLVCLMMVGVFVAVLRWSRTVPLEECSEVYRRYCDMEGIRASYVKDYRVNDTLTVGVTLLEAEDTAAWWKLLERFNVPKEMTEDAGSGLDVCTWKSPKDSPETRYNPWLSDDSEEVVLEIVSMSFKYREICVFHTQNEQERDAVFSRRIRANL